ncbi:UDP-N-acetylmuramoyl-L-alanine--D-glutamate ligase [Luteimonas viscosa]|uniref:UDP-N-acetylmuramoyl-L-alanine--D-glutamate ligase n=1 Tax=Luteimonas viscosa TaxID=1132694 RepID=UPI0021CD10A5|nr:UDP-N-acetylmuramoyl-L-alanine--D-glutamate ligase [Luteimonas viscosa]
MSASPPSIAQLAGLRVALWGWGREGRAAYAALRGARESGIGIGESGERFPARLTLFCTAAEAEEARALGDGALLVETEASAERLSAFDVVVKSPGISPYRPEAVAAAAQGTRFIGGTALWFAQRPDARTICVTGTKGKSTTSALLAHILRAAGHRTALTGNIGQPLLELLDGEATFWVIELSSYQTRDVAASGVRPDVAVVTNVFPEHLDWHGSEARYVVDKLALLTEAHPRVAVLDANDATLSALALPDSDVRWFGRADGWHLRGEALWRGDEAVLDTRGLPVPGRHNRGNLCAVLAAIEALGLDAKALAPHALTFQPLPHRLQTLGTRDGVAYVNDSISTTPHASLAALDVFGDRRVAILVGGHDRGLDWQPFVEAIGARPPAAIVTMGQNGPRIHALLSGVAGRAGFGLGQAVDLGEAVARAQDLLGGEGVVLLSPGAPSFGAYRDYNARGRHFAALAGFDPEAIAAIPGIGIA